jgi:hypothetical protein
MEGLECFVVRWYVHSDRSSAAGAEFCMSPGIGTRVELSWRFRGAQTMFYSRAATESIYGRAEVE